MIVDIEKRFPNGVVVSAAFRHDFEAGSILVVFGPSGAGKTTILRCLAGLERPEAGTLVFRDETWLDAAAGVFVEPQRRRIGYVFQDAVLFPHLSARSNVEYGLASLPAADRRRRGDAMLELLGVGALAGRRPRELSGGEAQRVAVARALAPGPQLVLLDEPFGALDTPTRRRMRNDVRAAIQQAGASAILVTHDRTEAIAFGDHIAVVAGGRVRQIGPVGDVFRKPADLVVAQSLGVESVLPARVESLVDGLVELAIGSARLRAVDTEGLLTNPQPPLIPNPPSLIPNPQSLIPEVFACIRAEDVTIETQPSLTASARNHLPGRIVGIESEGPIERVTIDCGFTLAASITANARQEMGLEPGTSVVAAIKATSIHLVTRG